MQQIRSEEDYQALVADRISKQIEDARAGLRSSVGTKAAARILNVHFDTLSDWRNSIPPKGPPFGKGSDSEGRGNEWVQYNYLALIEWDKNRQGLTTKEKRLIDELEALRQRTRELELELQVQEAKDHLAKLKKKIGRKLDFSTLANCTTAEDWAIQDGMVMGHVLTVNDSDLIRALDDDDVFTGSLDAALSLPWHDEAAREPFASAMEDALADAGSRHEAGYQTGLDAQRKREREKLRVATAPPLMPTDRGTKGL